MDSISVATISFGLRIIQELGISGSMVFSPIFLLLAEFSGKKIAMRNEIRKLNMDKDQISKLEHISETEFQTIYHLNLINTSFHATWKYRYAKSHDTKLEFLTASGKVRHLKYVYPDPSLGELLVSNNVGFRMAQDEVFSILEIPLIGKRLRFVIFLPNEEFTLGESLKKLDPSRIKDLLDQLTVANIHYKIPYFQMRSVIDTRTLLGLKSSKFHKFRFDWRKPSEDYIEENDDFDESFIKRPPDQTPYHFIANRPFFYAVFKEELPHLMGVFTDAI